MRRGLILLKGRETVLYGIRFRALLSWDKSFIVLSNVYIQERLFKVESKRFDTEFTRFKNAISDT